MTLDYLAFSPNHRGGFRDKDSVGVFAIFHPVFHNPNRKIMNLHGKRDLRMNGYPPAVLTGLLLGISFPTYPSLRLELLFWIAFVPLLLELRRQPGFRQVFLHAYTAMLMFCAVSLWWIGLATMGGGLLTVLAHAFFMCVPFMAFHLLRTLKSWRFALYCLPFVWVGWEWLYIQQDLSFAWLVLGNSQALMTHMIQYADITGVWGISLWLLFMNALAADAIDRYRSGYNPWPQSAAALVLVVLPLLYGMGVLAGVGPGSAQKRVTACIVQPNIDPYTKWHHYNTWELMEVSLRMTDLALMHRRADVVLWPETAIPFHILDEPYDAYFEALVKRQERWGSTLLSGFSDIRYYDRAEVAGREYLYGYDERSGRYFMTYNASMFLPPDGGDVTVYRKMKLVPFAERVPYVEYFPWLERFTVSLAGIRSWGRGEELTTMEIDLENGDRARLMNIICYESIFPGLVARFVQEGAEFLTLVTNDGWYATSYGPYQHAAIARLRCIENRRSMVRCANTGVSQFIDMAGRVYADLPWWQARTLTADVDCNSELTFYTRYPLLVPLLSLSVATGLFLFSLFSRKRRRRENPIPES